MALKVTADPNTRIIELTEAPSGGQVSINAIEDVYSALKDDWATDAVLQRLKFPFEPVGGQDISDTEQVGKFVFLRNDAGWRMQPFDDDHELRVIGNLFPRDPDTPLWLSRTGKTIVIQTERSSTTTSLQQKNIEFSSYNGGVTVDTASSFSGTSFPVGTLQAPVNNFSDAETILNERGLSDVFLRSSLTLNSNENLTGDHIIGQFRGLTLDIGSTVTVDRLRLGFLDVTGSILGNNCEIHDCLVTNLTYEGKLLENCLLSGTLSFSGGGPFIVKNCVDADPSGTLIVLDLSGVSAGSSVSIRGFLGGLEIRNCSVNTDVAIDIQGRVNLDSTVTAGSFRVRGIGHVVDNSTGTTVNTEDLIVAEEIGDVWRLAGLDTSDPLEVNTTYRRTQSGQIDQTISEDGGTGEVTVTRN